MELKLTLLPLLMLLFLTLTASGVRAAASVRHLSDARRSAVSASSPEQCSGSSVDGGPSEEPVL
jgi:hypothetical protein